MPRIKRKTNTPPAKVRQRAKFVAGILRTIARGKIRFVGCYECCGRHGSRSDLWDNLCTVCHKITRGQSCCGYTTVQINPRIRVPRVNSNRWKEFLRAYPQFQFKPELKIIPKHQWKTSAMDSHQGNVWDCKHCNKVITTVEENFDEVMENELCPVRRTK
jgi:hypothetical protein